MDDQTVPCTYCGEPTPMLGTRLCDPCWHGERHLDHFASRGPKARARMREALMRAERSAQEQTGREHLLAHDAQWAIERMREVARTNGMIAARGWAGRIEWGFERVSEEGQPVQWELTARDAYGRLMACRSTAPSGMDLASAIGRFAADLWDVALRTDSGEACRSCSGGGPHGGR